MQFENICVFIISVETIILIFFIIYYFSEKVTPPSVEKISRPKKWDFDDIDSDRFIITNINLQKINSWSDPQIKLWLANPIGLGMRVDDKKYELNGRIKNPPAKGSVKIYVLLSATEIWYQGEFPLNEKGEWNGWVYFTVGQEEEYKKIIRLELYEWENEKKEKIDTYDIIIE